LEGLAESDYRHLINDYVSAMHQKFLKTGKKKITYLSTEQISQIIGFSQRSSNSLKHSRPIYIILATDAVINGRDISSWNTTQMMKYIYDRDRKQWCDMIKDTLVLRGLENGLIYATIFGEWIVGNKLEIANGDACTDIENGLQDSNLSGPVKDWLMQMCELRPGETQSLKIKAYEPDIVGEFYVLKQLENCISSKNDWYNLIFNNLPKGSRTTKSRPRFSFNFNQTNYKRVRIYGNKPKKEKKRRKWLNFDDFYTIFSREVN